MITVPRDQMPQVDEKDIPRLLVYLGVLGVKLSAGHIPVSRLVPHQDVDWVKARALANVAKDVLTKPVLITSDECIIDGNHRVAAHTVAGIEFIGYIQIGVTFEEAIPLLNSFPYAYNIQPTTPERN